MGFGILKHCHFLQYCFLLLLPLYLKIHPSQGSDTISPGQTLSGNQTLVSPEGNFELGFFTPATSSRNNYYIGIWYKKVPGQTVVWVANPEQPVSYPSLSAFKLSDDGNLLLILFNHSKTSLWSANFSSSSNVSTSTRAMLLDNGNFMVTDDSSSIIWQSFDYPTDTWLPGGKLGYNKHANQDQMLISWRSLQNPAASLFSFEFEQNGTSCLLMWNRSQLYWTSGEWTGSIFRNTPEIEDNFYITNMTYVSNEKESYFTYASAIPSAFTRFVIDVTGQLRQFVWQESFGEWRLFWAEPQQCQVYAFCGAFSICNHQLQPSCACFEGFVPKTNRDWELNDHTDGCVRKALMRCVNGRKDTFRVIYNVQFPSNSENTSATTGGECEFACLNDCSCNAFAYSNGQCLIWKGQLFNVQQLLPDQNIGGELHVRIAKPKKQITWIVVAVVAGFCSFSGILVLILWSRQRCRQRLSLGAIEDSLVVFKYKELRRATNNFSEKLGQGGFGSVYKGTFPNSTMIAVKQLGGQQQGEKQFMAEVKTIGIVQHINLVRLRGFCADGSGRFLVYDYMPNGSLGTHLFRKSAKTLDWKSRYNIAIGSARGLAYLHEECRDCIIHCDIKPENILLDAECNPKVADLGLAKILGREFSRVLTTLRGTRGYLAPEWISGEALTPKADVFSYGMLLCELISGRRNSETYDDEAGEYFPFLLANTVNREEDTALKLLDDRLEGNANAEEVTRACKVASWCIQDDAKERPTMRQVVQILEGVSEIGTPSIPRFLQQLAGNSEDVMFSPKILSTPSDSNTGSVDEAGNERVKPRGRGMAVGDVGKAAGSDFVSLI